MQFSWDEAKNRANQRKHGISFDEARAVFDAADYLEVFDEAHSDEEDRFIAIGFTPRGVVVVVWAQSDDDWGRIISARMATTHEERLFESYVGTRDD